MFIMSDRDKLHLIYLALEADFEINLKTLEIDEPMLIRLAYVSLFSCEIEIIFLKISYLEILTPFPPLFVCEACI